MTQDMPPEKPDTPFDDALPTSEEAADPKAETIARRTDTLKRVISALQTEPGAAEKSDEISDADMTLRRPPHELLDVLEQIKGEILLPPGASEKVSTPATAKPKTEPVPAASDKPKTEPVAAPQKPKTEPVTQPVSEKPKTSPVMPSASTEEKPSEPTVSAPDRDKLLQKLEELERLGAAGDETIVSIKASAKDLRPDTAPKAKSEPTRPDTLLSEKRTTAEIKKVTGELRTPTGELKRATNEMKVLPAERPQPRVIDAESITKRPENALTGSPDEAPWTLQQFFNGEIDLDVELTKRFPTMPMMSLVKFRTLGASAERRVATLSTQDGAASLIIDGDVKTKVIQLSFTLGSMLTLRFAMTSLSDMDRTRWLELMRREQGGLAFLWGPERWAEDYMICISRKYHTNLYAFSPHNFDAAIRLTPAVTKQLLDWLDEFWKAEDKSDDEQPPLLTW